MASSKELFLSMGSLGGYCDEVVARSGTGLHQYPIRNVRLRARTSCGVERIIFNSNTPGGRGIALRMIFVLACARQFFCEKLDIYGIRRVDQWPRGQTKWKEFED